MTSEKRTSSSSTPPFADFNFSEPPPIPAVAVTPLASQEADLDHWAEERIAIYASLDADMTRHIIEAISALSELKQRVEDEAFSAAQSILTERDRLRREVEELRLEQLQIEDRLKDNRRFVDEEEARRIALEHSSAAWMQQAQAERDELQLEVRRLKVQLEEVRADLQAFYRRRAEAVEAGGGFAAWLEKQAAPEAEKYAEPITPPPPPDNPMRLDADSLGDLPIFSLENLDEPAIPVELDPFGDAPTPRIPGGSPVLTAELPVAEPVAAVRVPPNPLDLSDDPEVAEDHADVVRLFDELNAPPLSATSEPSVDLAVPSEAEKTSDRQRRARTEQRLNQLIKKRRPEADEMEAINAPVSTGRVRGRRKAVAVKGVSDPVSEKEALQEIGAQLGLDAMTPPPVVAMHFASGFTPPPEPVQLNQVMSELKANAEALVGNTRPVIRPLRASLAPLPDSAPSQPEVKSASVPTSFIEPEEGPRSLEELLQDGVEELATINENPTPPEDPTPFIGNLSDNAVHFHTAQATPTGQTRPDRVEDAPAPGSLPTLAESVEADTRPDPRARATVPLNPLDPRRRATDPLVSPSGGIERPLPVLKIVTDPVSRRRSTGGFGIMPLPPPPSSPSEQDIGETNLTRLMVSNLQGRFSPLLMEKVVRNLNEVVHVIVTEFSKGVLGMDVRHRADFDLAQKLLSMPELHLRLIEQEGDKLELAQETVG